MQAGKREIDDILDELSDAFPGLGHAQLQATHPADDDGLWYIYPPGCNRATMQIESSNGSAPFLIEWDNGSQAGDRAIVNSADEAVRLIERLILQKNRLAHALPPPHAADCRDSYCVAAGESCVPETYGAAPSTRGGTSCTCPRCNRER